MTDIQHINVDDEQYEDAPQGLRDYVKKLQKQNETLRTERDGFRNQISESALGDVLAGFKNPGRVKTDLLSDGVDPLDNEAVTKWLETNGDDYARGEQTPAAPESEVQDETQVPDYDRLNSLSQLGTPSGSDKAQIVANPPAELLNDPQALADYFRKQGI
jgi:hypothetical protein